MFTGLIETLGKITSTKSTGNGIVLALKPAIDFDVALGDSVAINGVCLTVTAFKDELAFDVSPETLKSTNLGELKTGNEVNLERAMRLSDRLGGHIVTGHVDGIGTITTKKTEGEYIFYTVESPPEVLKYIVQKGSVAIDGISLTVVESDNSSFRIAIIPHTLTATNIGSKRIGDRVNLEADIIGKYVDGQIVVRSIRIECVPKIVRVAITAAWIKQSGEPAVAKAIDRAVHKGPCVREPIRVVISRRKPGTVETGVEIAGIVGRTLRTEIRPLHIIRHNHLLALGHADTRDQNQRRNDRQYKAFHSATRFQSDAHGWLLLRNSP